MAESLILKQGGGVGSDELTATLAQVLSGYTAVTEDSDDDIGTGTMANRGAVNQSLNAGSSYTIPQGYHNGNGKVTANSLASQTLANAVAANMTSGKTAWVNGTKITGNGQDNQTFYNSGHSDGYSSGYSAGYTTGYTAGKNESNMLFIDSATKSGGNGSATASFVQSGYRKYLIVVCSHAGSPSATLDGSALQASSSINSSSMSCAVFLTNIVGTGQHTINGTCKRQDNENARVTVMLYGLT